MKSIVSLLLIFAMLFITIPTNADEKYALPDGVDYTLDGKNGVFLTLDEYKKVGFAYIELGRLINKDRLISYKYEIRLDIEKNYELRIENCSSHVKLMEFDRDFWKIRSEELVKNIRSINRSNKAEKIVYWVVIGLLSVSDLVLVIDKVSD